MKSSLFTLIIILIIFISYNNNLFLAQQQQSSWQSNDKEHKFIVFHKFPQQISYTKRGEVIVITNKAVSQYIGVNDNVLFDDVEYSSPFYLIKLVDENDQNNVLKSFTKMCLLKSSNFEDEIIIHLDKHNKPFHFDYYTLKDQCNDTIKVQSDKINNEFKTSIQTVRSINGVRLHKALPVKEDGTVEKPPEEKSFLQKYWWYLIPLALLLMTSTPPPAEEELESQHQAVPVKLKCQ
ncbi:14399_t:CDS:2 [Entrophospora sp. SA101]|nr:14399_t:CDS:2 [Entrophospora sp. SA101]